MDPNRLYCGDCLQVLQTSIPDESVDLVYMDPPFGSGTDYEVVFNDGVEVRHFKDRWIGGKTGYLDWAEKRIRECHRVLKDAGAFCLHCDDHLNGYLRVLCDQIFGEGNFVNEIVWKRTQAHGDAKRFGRIHDTLLLYRKTSKWKWTALFEKYSEEYLRKSYRFAETRDGRIVDWDWSRELPGGWRILGSWPMDSPHPRPNLMYTYKGYPPPVNGWRVSIERMKELDAKGLLWFPDSQAGRIRRKGYLDEQKGRKLQDLWVDIDPIQSAASERQDFPTQKPPELLERLIQSCSKVEGIVLDPVCGCGTALIAARKLGRSWIGIDISPTSCRLVARRLGVGVNDIVGLPRSMAEVKEMVKLDPIEFQNWVCDILHAVSTTHRGQRPRADANIDGWILSQIPIQVKGSEGVGYGEVERFRTSLKKRGKTEGYIVAFSFSKPAFEEAVRSQKEERITIDLLEVTERAIAANGGNPDVRTFLYSQLSKRSWGETPETSGPPPPPPLMIPIRPAKAARVRKLTDHPAAAIPTPPPTEEDGEADGEP